MRDPDTAADPPAPGDTLPRPELNRRVSGGVFIVASWGLVNLLLGFGGNVVLARMLVPRDFGIVAIGATITAFAATLSEGGLGSGLIRRPAPPTDAELRAVVGLQLALMGIFSAVTAAVSSSFGTAGLVVALMVASLPLSALQTPGKVVLSRALRFRQLTTADAVGTVTYYVVAVAGVVGGLGVWALALGVVARALAATCAMLVLSPETPVRPSIRGVRALRPVIAFGIRFQGISFAGMAREQTLNAAVAALTSVATLGLWTLAKRLLEIPLLVIEPLHRVAFPYMSQVHAAHEDPGPVIERAMRVTATALGCVLVGLAAGATGLVPGIFGAQWADTAIAVQWVCGSLLVAAPLATVAVGYLYAIGEPSVVLRATILHSLTLFAVCFPLLPVAGMHAIGAGSLAGAIVDVLVIGLAVQRRTATPALRLAAAAVALGVPAAIAGAVITSRLGDDLAAGLAGAAAGAACYAGAVYVFRRAAFVDTASLLRRSVRAGLGRQPAASVAGQPS
jgi:O-antigen/teichoic acid export membrane protein